MLGTSPAALDEKARAGQSRQTRQGANPAAGLFRRRLDQEGWLAICVGRRAG